MFAAASARAGAVAINAVRLVFAFVFLAVTILVMRLDTLPSSSQLSLLSISGFFGLVVGDSFLFKAYETIGPRVSMLVMSLAPGIAAVLAYIFLGESPGALGLGGMALTLAGVMLVVAERGTRIESGRTQRVGIAYAFLGALGQAAGLIFAKQAFNLRALDGFLAAIVRVGVAVLLLLPGLLATRRYRNDARVIFVEKRVLMLTVLASVLGPFLGISFSLIAVSHTEVGIAATLMSLPPIIMLPIARYYFRETLSWRAVAGALLAVAGVALLFFRA